MERLREMDLAVAVLRGSERLVRLGWTQDAKARDSGGRAVRPVSPEAVRWCAGGAIERAAGDLREPDNADLVRAAARCAARALRAEIDEGSIALAARSDEPGRTQEEAAEALRRAACDLEAARYDLEDTIETDGELDPCP